MTGARENGAARWGKVRIRECADRDGDFVGMEFGLPPHGGAADRAEMKFKFPAGVACARERRTCAGYAHRIAIEKGRNAERCSRPALAILAMAKGDDGGFTVHFGA